MRLPEFSYLEPGSVQEACALLATPDSLALAGGTDLLVSLKYRLFGPSRLVDIKSIAGLAGIEAQPGGGIRAGALTTLRAIERSPLVKELLPLVAEGARSVASPQIRNKATIGGNICLNTRCWYFNMPRFSRQTREACNKQGGSVCHVVPGEKRGKCYSLFSADVVPALIAAGARVAVSSDNGSRTVPLRDLFTGDGIKPNALQRGELVTTVLVPPLPRGAGSCYLKLRERGTLDFPILGIAAVLALGEDKRTCAIAKVVLTGVSSGPVEAEVAQARLENRPVTELAIAEVAALVQEQTRVFTMNGIPARYKRSVIGEYVSRALMQAWQRAKGPVSGSQVGPAQEGE